MINRIFALLLFALLASCARHECAPFDYKATGIDTLDYQGYRLFSDGRDTVMVEFRNFDTYYNMESAGGLTAKGGCKNGFSTEVVCDELKSSFWIHFIRTDEGHFFRATSPHIQHVELRSFSVKNQIKATLSEPGFAGKDSPILFTAIQNGEIIFFMLNDHRIWNLLNSNL